MASNRPTRREDEEEEMMASESTLWMPRSVVKRHRRKATVIWVSLIVCFLAYVAYVVWETIKSRKDPAASFQIKKEYYPFPDVGVCVQNQQGCRTYYTGDCIGDAIFGMTGQFGFLDDTLEPDEASLAIEDEYPCKVLPLSKLTVDEAGIENGEVDHFSVSLLMEWYDDPHGDYDPTLYDPDDPQGFNNPYQEQFVSLFFLDVDKGGEGLEEELNDAKLPYSRVQFAFNETLTATTNHVVLDMMEFEAISTSSGAKQDAERTYTQVEWYWDGETYDTTALLLFNLFIPKFEYTHIEEVDPVDAWAIIGAVGGVWQFVVIAFGMFFVFSEKQPPSKKMRNFKKSAAIAVQPVASVARRFSSVSSAGTSTQDIVVDASDEDLPAEWVKRQKKNGTFYYCNTMTGAIRDNSPNEPDTVVATGAPVAAPTQRRGIGRMFKPAHKTGSGSDWGDGAEFAGEKLPPGWQAKKDSAGKTYYVNNVLKTTQWERPVQRTAFTVGPSMQVQAVDAPMARRSSHNPSSSVDNSNNGGHGGGRGGGGAGARSRAAAAAPAAPDSPTSRSPAAPGGPAPPVVSKAPSYRTMVQLLNNSDGGGGGGDAQRPGAKGGNAGVRDSSAGITGGVGGGTSSASLPAGWVVRYTAKGEKYYANTSTEATQWHAPSR